MMNQGTVEASNHTMLDASLLVHQFGGSLVLVENLWMTTRVHLEFISTLDNDFCDLETFDFISP